MPIRRTTLAALATAAWLVAAGPVAADCDLAGPIEQELPAAPVAFVGTVATVEGPTATFTVSEVWAGEVAEVVQVHGLMGGPRDPKSNVGPAAISEPNIGPVVSEDDRTWTIGGTYLVVPTVDGAILRDHICTATTEWRPELELLRPDDARIVSSAAETEASAPVAVILVAVVVVLVAGASVLAFRRP